MPFVTNLVDVNEGHVLYAVVINDVDSQNDRLRITAKESGGEEESIVCVMVEVNGKRRLRVDREHTDPEFVKLIDELTIEDFGEENTDDLDAFILASALTDSTDLLMSIPPVLAIGRDGMWETYESELGPGDTIQIESITIN